MHDIIIIGCGVIGASVARELAKYKLDVLVLEKNSDVGMETSSANSAIIHSGYDPKFGTLKAKLNQLGNYLMEEVCNDLDVEFKRIGSLTIATSKEEEKILNKLLENAKKNNVECEIISKEKLLEMEPNITKNASKALLAKTCAIINPFELVVGLMENAIDNGVKLLLNSKVTNIEKENDRYNVYVNDLVYQTKVIINCAGLYSDVINNMVMEKKEKILPRKGEYYVLDHLDYNYCNHVLFSVPTKKGKGVLVTPTTNGNYLIGPSSEFVMDKEDVSTDSNTLEDVLEKAYKLVDFIPTNKIIRQFSGNRSYHESGDFVINDKDGFINLLGIQSPGLASSQAIAHHTVEILSGYFYLNPNPKFNPKRKKLYRVNKLSIDDRNKLIKKNRDFGEIVCRCEQITKGEIIDSIHRSCGARTVKGIKYRLRPGFGKCQGGFCQSKILEILSKELGKNPLEINYGNDGSYIVCENLSEEKHE